MQDKAAQQAKLEEIREQIARLESDLDDKPDYGLGRGDPMVTRWELNRALLARLRRRAGRVHAALERLQQGQYGICERCGGDIHPERLGVLPETRVCVRCARQASPAAWNLGRVRHTAG